MKGFHVICQFALVLSSVDARVATVTTTQGVYTANTILVDIDKFLGIPFAAPPVGNLRFAPPEPYVGSSSHRVNATSYGPGCLSYPSSDGLTALSEDCLTLNIIRPALPLTNGSSSFLEANSSSYYSTMNTQSSSSSSSSSSELLPVVFFIYGGANINGKSEWYDGTNLVQTSANISKPIIYVSANYRVGGLGWLYNTLFASHNLLNIGLKDQRLALQWVHDNIKAFGGDPAKVTIMGQSAGAFNIWMQMRGEEVNGQGETGALFRGAIEMSGAPASLALKGHYPSDGDAYLTATFAATNCSNSTDQLACLRALSASELSSVWFDSSSPLYETLDEYIQEPVGFAVDGEWITTPFYWSERVVGVPLICGTTLNDGSIYTTAAGENATDRDYLISAIARDLNTTNLTLAAPILSTYYNHTPAQNGRGYNASTSLTDTYYIAEAVLGDTVQEIPRRTLLATHAKNNATPTWSYKSLQRPPLSVFALPYYGFGGLPDVVKERLGVLHASDLSLVFGDVYGFEDASEGDIEVARIMQEMWINFVSDLDPNNDRGTNDAVYWERYDPDRAKLFYFQEQGNASSGMRADDMRLDSYDAYRDAVEKAGLPPLPKISQEKKV